MPFDALLQLKRIGMGSFIIAPALCKAGNYVIIGVVGGKAVEQKQIDLSMLVQRRVDAGIIAASIDQGGATVVVGIGGLILIEICLWLPAATG